METTRFHPTAVIAINASLSGAVDVGENRALCGIYMPAVWTAAALSFAVCDTLAGTYLPLFGIDGEVTVSAAIAVASQALTFNPLAFLPFRFVKVRSGLVGAAVNQAAARTLTLVVREIE